MGFQGARQYAFQEKVVSAGYWLLSEGRALHQGNQIAGSPRASNRQDRIGTQKRRGEKEISCKGW